uniref:Mitochondrial import inner membrane translocase subunit TIM50 n=1 Tax=Setaria digitata TaxID=48799 RepID=A0A915Q3Q1_9BILA
MLSNVKGIDGDREEFVGNGGEKTACKIGEDLFNSSNKASTVPKVNVKPNVSTELLQKKIRMRRREREAQYLQCFLLPAAHFLDYWWMKRDEDSAYTGILAPYYRIKEACRSWRNFVIEPSRDKLLPDPLKPPYWQPKYTVVIELRNILVAPEWSYKMGNRVKKRPAVDYLLDVIGYPNFEVVIYTSETALNANPIVEALDSKQKIMYKLYRDCCKYMNGVYVKDLSKLNRDLSKVIYIDFDPESFRFNPENVLRLPKWDGTLDDTALVDLAELLKTIHLSDVDDVRPTLQYYSQFDDPLKEFRERATRVAEMEKKMHQMESEKEAYVAPVKKYQGRLFGFRRHE